MENPSAKAPPPNPPWEIAFFRVVGAVVFGIGAILFFIMVFASVVGTISFDAKLEGFTWTIGFCFAGLLLRAVAGIWSALERIAHRLDDPVSDEPVRRALLGIWETLTKK